MLVLTCPVCRKDFNCYPSDNRKTCSVKCRTVLQKRKPKVPKRWTRLGMIWRGLKWRCYDKNCPAYEYYGGQGITICPSWRRSFRAFYSWAIKNGYAPSLELDRKNPSRSYSPSNCRWATRTQQMQNTRKRRNALTSRYKGVSKYGKRGSYRVQIVVNKKSKHVGCFKNEIVAAKAYDSAARKYFGEFALVNFPRKGG